MPHLSPREREILDLRLRGKTLKEASARLGISLNTSRTHMRRAYLKFAARTIAELLFVSRHPFVRLPKIPRGR